MYLFELVFLFSSDKYPEVELLDQIVALLLVFKGITILFSIVATQIYIPSNSVQRFPFFHILNSTCYLLSFYNSHPNGCEVISHCGFDLNFPND